jgi:3-oxoacyl-[acyl-carrier-protein] synthase-3
MGASRTCRPGIRGLNGSVERGHVHTSDIYLYSACTALPGPPVDNAALARRFGLGALWEQWADTFIGTRSRYLAIDLDTGEISHTLADLGETAARRALSAVGLLPGAVDVVVMGTATPDALMPATVNMIADRLGMNHLPTYQLQSGCAGAIGALDVAYQALLTGRHETALVVGGDVGVKHYDFSLDLAALPPEQQVNALLFGDGAGAAVLGTQPAPGAPRIRRLFVEFTGLGRPPGQVVEWFGQADRGSGRPGGAEDYKAIEELVPAMAGQILRALLDDLDWKQGELDFLLPPQLSGRMSERIARELAVPEARLVSCVHETGNNGNALVFHQLERLLPQMSSGDRAIAIAVESSKWIKAGLALEAE